MLKVCFALLLASLSISLTFALDICEHQGNGVRLAHPADCNKFVICRNGLTAIIKTCPIGLHFNRFKGVCDLKERAACDIEFVQLADSEVDCTACCAVCGCDGSTPSTPETPVTDETPCPGTPTPGTPATPSPETPGTPAIPSPETPGTPITPSPETPGTSATPFSETPATPSPETPGTPVTPSPETPVTRCGNNITVCVNKPDGSVSHVNGTCNQYIVCSGGCANTMNCPNNLQYNLSTNNCDYPENVDCPWESKPPITGPSGVACAQPGECAGKKDGTMLADPESNGNGYIVCQCECEIKMPCPSGTKFDVELQLCGNPNNTGNSSSNGNGHAGNNNGNGNSTNAVTCVTDVCKEGDELLPVDGECNKFYQCDNNCAIEIICPNNLIYNPASKQCDFPQNYNCPWPYTPPSGPSEGPSGIACASGGRCTDKPEGALLPSLVSDSKFVVCQCQCEVERDCPSGLIWDNQKFTCNWPNTLIN